MSTPPWLLKQRRSYQLSTVACELVKVYTEKLRADGLLISEDAVVDAMIRRTGGDDIRAIIQEDIKARASWDDPCRA